MYKITPNTMAYVSYADSLEQGGTAPTDESVKNAGQTLNPYRSKQYEVGLKSDIGEMNLAPRCSDWNVRLPILIRITCIKSRVTRLTTALS